MIDKVVPFLGERRRLFIAPDGELSLIPFEALPWPTDGASSKSTRSRI